jgi:hypothetical protein
MSTLLLMACGSQSNEADIMATRANSSSSARLQLTGEGCSLTSKAFALDSDSKQLLDLTYVGKDTQKQDLVLNELMQLGHLKNDLLDGKILESQKVADDQVVVVEGPVLPKYSIKARKTAEGFEVAYSAEALLNRITREFSLVNITISYDKNKKPTTITVQDKKTGLFGKTRNSTCRLKP